MTAQIYLISYSLRRLSHRLQQAQASEVNGKATAVLSFDKDDDDTLDFVAASANMRSIIFGIPSKSKFDIKRRFYLVFTFLLAETLLRDGGKHHPSDCNNQCNDGGPLRDASIQGAARRSAQSQKRMIIHRFCGGI